MPNPILLLRLEGPLQSWGTRSRWDVRDSGDEPTKSGVIGLLGCALGLERGHPMLLELDRGLRFGVRVENAGRKVTDYQTITDFLPTAAGAFKMSGSKTASTIEAARRSGAPATVISPRDYLEDAAFLVGLEARAGAEGLLKKAAEKVQTPRWPLFLGRKACVPVRPIFADFTAQYQDLEAALMRYPWEWLGFLRESKPDAFKNQGRPERERLPQRLNGWIETDDPLAPGAVSRQDALESNRARVYGFRLAEPFTVSLDNLDSSNLNEVQL